MVLSGHTLTLLAPSGMSAHSAACFATNIALSQMQFEQSCMPD
jgi:hypothetical protein